jgi:hypothetical protein
MSMRGSSLVRLSLVLALVPALAIAAPKAKKRTKKTTPPPTTPLPVSTPADPAAPTPDAAPVAPAPSASASQAAPATPAPAPPAAAPAEPKDKPASSEAAASGDPDVDALRQEYLSLRDELFKSRARANTVASQLYSTRIQIKLTYTTARFYNPAKSTIRLDGASVYEDTSGAIGGDDGVRFDGFVAPGRHLVTFRVEATGKDDDTFTSATETQIVVKAVAGKDLVVAAKAKDSGDIAYEWKRKEKGSYGLGVDVAVKTVAHAGDGAAASAAPAPAPAKGAKK